LSHDRTLYIIILPSFIIVLPLVAMKQADSYTDHDNFV